MNKKFTALFAAALFTAGLAACGTADAHPDSGTGGGNEYEARTGASIAEDAEQFRGNFMKTGHWIGATTNHLNFTDDFVIEGDFWDKDDHANNHKRKVALYSQDENQNILDRFDLTAPRVIVRSPNTVIAKGRIIGDVHVEANGFELDDATIEGNLSFGSEEYRDSAKLDDGHVTGNISVD